MRKKKDVNYKVDGCEIYQLEELYETSDFDALKGSEGIIEYLDTAEEEHALISTDYDFNTSKPYTHVDIHPSLMLGVMGNQIVFSRK